MNANIRRNDINNKEISQFNVNIYNLDNNYKSINSTRYYYKNNNYRVINNNDRDYLRNKNNSYYKTELVEVEDICNNTKKKMIENIVYENNNINGFDEDEYKNLMINNVKGNRKDNNNNDIN